MAVRNKNRQGRRSPFLDGVARAINIAGGVGHGQTGEGRYWDKTEDALRADWEAVGRDLKVAIDRYGHQHPQYS